MAPECAITTSTMCFPFLYECHGTVGGLWASGKRTGEFTRSLTGNKIKSVMFSTVVDTVVCPRKGSIIKLDLFEWEQLRTTIYKLQTTVDGMTSPVLVLMIQPKRLFKEAGCSCP